MKEVTAMTSRPSLLRRACVLLLIVLIPAASAPAQNGEVEAIEPVIVDPPRVESTAMADGDETPMTAPEELPAEAAPAEEEPSGGGEVLEDGRVMLNFRNASLNAVLAFVSEATGVVVVTDTEVEGRVNVISRQAVTMDEALAVLSSVLKDKGYAAVRTGRTLRIVPLDAAKRANIPVFSGSDPQRVLDNDEVITQVIPVRYADAVQLKRDLAPLIPLYADLSSNASSNTLILTDTGSNVRRIMQVISALDTAVSSVTQVKVFSLKYANASNAARLITEVFQPEVPVSQQRTGQFGQFVARFGGGPGGGGGGPGGRQQAEGEAEGVRPQTKVTAAADDRTNTVVVSAPADMLPLIEKVLNDLDANPAQDQAVFIYYMRNGQAVNAETVVNNLFGTTGTGRTTTSRTTTRTTPSAVTPSGSSMGLSQVGTGARTTAATTAATAGRQTAAAPARTTVGLSSGASQAAADLAGQVYAVADPDTNSLLVMTASNNFDRVRSILDELDRPIPQVLIKVLIAEVTHEDEHDLGVEFSAINLRTSGDTTIFTDFGVAAATGGLVAKLVETDVTVAIRALERVGKLDVLSRPYILTSDNQMASIIVGQQVPRITNTRVTDTGQTINTIQYEDIGIILNVTPHINPDGLVIMDVIPEISSIIPGVTVPISENVNAPVFAKRSAQTRVAIQNGQTIVIGGLMEDRKTETTRKVPLLGDIPLLGQLFRRDEKLKAKTELLIFLTPHVAHEPGQLEAMSKDEQAGAVVTPQAVKPGVFEEHMEGMQRGATPAER